MHRASVVCRSCHMFMDPIGLSLDNFGVTGKWRIREGGNLLDTRGQLYDGTPLSSPSDLLKALLSRPTPLLRNFATNLMAYALGRRVESFDMPTIRAVVRDAEANDHRISTYVLGIVNSPAFRMQRAEGMAGQSDRSAERRDDRWHSSPESMSHAATFLRGVGATVALPLLDAMVPAGRPWSPNDPIRLVAIEQVHGAAGSSPWGSAQYMWAPQAVGQNFDLSPSALLPLEPYRDYLTIISNTDVRMAEAYDPKEIGADHFRSSAVFLTQSHPTQTESSDVFVGTSLDQMYARRFGQGHADPLDAAVHRERGQGGRLRVRLLLRVHGHEYVGVSDRTSAHDP